MRTFKSSCLLIITLALSGAAAGFADGPLRVALSTSGTELIVADDMHLDCVVTAPAGLRVELPSAEIELKDWTLAEFAKEPPVLLENGDVRYRVHYTLEPFLPGSYTLPVLVIRAGEWKVETPASEIEVRGIIEAPQKADLRPLAKEPDDSSSHWPEIVLVLAVLGFGLWCGIRKRPSAEPSGSAQALAAIESASDIDELAVALRQWAPELLVRLDAFRFKHEEPDADLSALICELRKELS